MFKIGDLVTPRPAFVNDGKVFQIIDVDLQKEQYKIEPKEKVYCRFPSNYWKEDELYLVRTIDSLELQLSQQPLRTLASIIEEAVENFHFGNIGFTWKQRELTKKVISNSPETIWFNTRNIDREENDMSKILEIYKEKKEKEIRKKFSDEVEAITKADTIQSFMKEMNEQLETLIENEFPNDTFIPLTCDYLTKDTENVKRELIKLKNKDLEDLNNKIKEIEALLELAPGYEEKIKILRDYEIVDKKKNIIL